MTNHEEYEQFANEYCQKVLEKIKRVMEKSNISQGMLASKSGLSQSTVSKFLAGDTRVSLIHVAKICKALEIDPGEILSFREPMKTSEESMNIWGDDKETMLIRRPSHPAYRGYLREFNVYFNSTISSEDKILQGKLIFQASENGKCCVAKLMLDTGKRKGDGTPVEKKYEGEMLISLSMSACYCILQEKNIGEICFFSFSHIFLFNEDLGCRLACATTVSSGGNKRPTMHRLLLSRQELDVDNVNGDDFRMVRGQLMLNSSDILIEAGEYRKLKEAEEELPDREGVHELLDDFEQCCDSLEVYRIEESKLRKASCTMEDKVKVISLLRSSSLNNKYNKISTKADEYMYSYLENKYFTKRKKEKELED
ncbi:MAG: helix-turn-helix transcriptional regulator [Clostridiales bacterium]|nr:helix-turn-helix transcriptional regulator [Clostridiales bacterium]